MVGAKLIHLQATAAEFMGQRAAKTGEVQMVDLLFDLFVFLR